MNIPSPFSTGGGALGTRRRKDPLAPDSGFGIVPPAGTQHPADARFGVQPPVSAAAPAAPTAPAAAPKPATPAPAATPEALKPRPAYVVEEERKAAERAQAKLDKMMAPAEPVGGMAASVAPATASPPPTPPSAMVAPDANALARTAAPADAQAAAASADQTLSPTEQQTGVAQSGDAATAVVDGGQTATATDTPTDPLAPADTDTPDVVSQKTQAQALDQQLRDYAQRMLTATEDPIFKQKFNQLLFETGLSNQAALDAAKMQVNRDPSLRGQPAGNAYLAMQAARLGMSTDQMKANLSIESARRVAEMNRDGFDLTYKLAQDAKSQDERDVEFYGNVIDRMLSSGDEAGAQRVFNERVLPLLGDKAAGMTFDQFRSAAERNTLLMDAREDRLEAFREALGRDDISGALSAIESAYSAEEQATRGKALAEKYDLAAINERLKAAGYEEIADMADLIGREDDLFIADEVVKAQGKLNETAVTSRRRKVSAELKDLGYDLTDPEVQDAIDDMVEWQLYGDPEKPYVFPWDPASPSQYRYTDWPVFDPTTGKMIYDGGKSYGEGNPRDPGDTWQRELDSAWQRYMQETPSGSRLSREDWFNEFKKWAEGVEGAGWNSTPEKILGSLETFKPGKSGVAPEDRVLAAKEGERAINEAKSFADVDWEDPNVREYVLSLPKMSGIDISKALLNLPAPRIINLNGSAYRVMGLDNVGGGQKNDYIRVEDQDGNTVWIKHGTSQVLTELPKAAKASAAGATPTGRR